MPFPMGVSQAVRNETKGMIGWLIAQILFVVIMLLCTSGCAPQEPSWKMLSRGTDAIFWDLHVSGKEIARLLYATRDKPGGRELAWDLQLAMRKVREAKWVAKDVGDQMRTLHAQQREQEESRKVLDNIEKP